MSPVKTFKLKTDFWWFHITDPFVLKRNSVEMMSLWYLFKSIFEDYHTPQEALLQRQVGLSWATYCILHIAEWKVTATVGIPVFTNGVWRIRNVIHTWLHDVGWFINVTCQSCFSFFLVHKSPWIEIIKIDGEIGRDVKFFRISSTSWLRDLV